MAEKRRGRGPDGESGSVLPLVAVWLAVAMLVMMAIVAGVTAAVTRARAQAAADAAALAGAAAGQTLAQVVAERNGGILERFVEHGPAVSPGGGGEHGEVGDLSEPGTDRPAQNHPVRQGRSAQTVVVVTVVVEVNGVSATAAAERFPTPVDFLNRP